jgi:hypothetical protein
MKRFLIHEFQGLSNASSIYSRFIGIIKLIIHYSLRNRSVSFGNFMLYWISLRISCPIHHDIYEFLGLLVLYFMIIKDYRLLHLYTQDLLGLLSYKFIILKEIGAFLSEISHIFVWKAFLSMNFKDYRMHRYILKIYWDF